MRRSFTLAAAFILALATAVIAEEKPAAEEGFYPLFDGKTLNGWQGGTDGYEVKDGVLICKPKGSGNLYTDKEYGNFVFRFEFKLTPGANNGVGLRTPMQGDPAFVGMEIQILDDGHPRYKELKEYQYHGSVYGVIAAKRGFLKPTGEWNSEEITLDGTKVKVVLNGETIVDGDFAEARDKGTIDGREHPGLKRDKGYIAFCGHGAHVEFRNIQIKELK
ncbi:MAG TPA: DUF1080 domain-containing protein [Pirellulaceae bacterium]|nr:DUF1080 domain-containing protein [Pirellulaceae bacterium]